MKQSNHKELHQLRQKWQLWQPIIGASLALHGLLLLIPISGSSPQLSEQVLQPQTQIPLQTISLEALLVKPADEASANSQYAPLQTDPSTESPGSLESVEIISNSSQTAQSPSPSLAPEPPPPSATQELAVTNVSETIPPTSDLDSVQHFFDQLAATTGLPTTVPAPSLFPDASLYFQSYNATEKEPTLHAEILNAVWIAGKTPTEIYISVLSSQLHNGEFQSIQKADYGGGLVYEVSQESTVWHLNLVPTADGNGTIIVVWKIDPSQLPEV